MCYSDDHKALHNNTRPVNYFAIRIVREITSTIFTISTPACEKSVMITILVTRTSLQQYSIASLRQRFNIVQKDRISLMIYYYNYSNNP